MAGCRAVVAGYLRAMGKGHPPCWCLLPSQEGCSASSSSSGLTRAGPPGVPGAGSESSSRQPTRHSPGGKRAGGSEGELVHGVGPPHCASPAPAPGPCHVELPFLQGTSLLQTPWPESVDFLSPWVGGTALFGIEDAGQCTLNLLPQTQFQALLPLPKGPPHWSAVSGSLEMLRVRRRGLAVPSSRSPLWGCVGKGGRLLQCPSPGGELLCSKEWLLLPRPLSACLRQMLPSHR